MKNMKVKFYYKDNHIDYGYFDSYKEYEAYKMEHIREIHHCEFLER